MPLNHPNCRCALPANERELAPRHMARTLVCYGGPWDGERRLLEADESEILLNGEGRYVAVAQPTAELLRWRATG